jgi:hypothetical protein
MAELKRPDESLCKFTGMDYVPVARKKKTSLKQE